jgi:hypothetical protein
VITAVLNSSNPRTTGTRTRSRRAGVLQAERRAVSLAERPALVPYTHVALVTEYNAAQASSRAILRRRAFRAVHHTFEDIVVQATKELSMPYVIGIVVSVGVALLGRYGGFDRDRAFYPTVLIVVGHYYVLFAAMGDSVQTVLLESAVMTLFVIAAVGGFKASPWIVVGALAGHGVFDAVHGHILKNAGVPVWWPAFCLAFDVGAAGALAWVVMRTASPRAVTMRHG